MSIDPAALNLPTPKIADHELLRCIGRGSFGQVWLARNIMGEYRAVKIVYRASFETERPLTQEFEAIKKYEPKSRSHPSLLSILHVGRNTVDEYFYYIMDLADNQTTDGQPLDVERYEAKTLLSEFKSKKRLPVDECIQIGLALTEALDYLHQSRLVHRDIKLSNVIFISGKPQLADVGLVTTIGGSKSFVGTEGYIPPEGPGTVQADVYALGKVLYEISTGNSRLDFPVIPLVGIDDAERKRFLALNAVFLKACNHNLKKRYETAKEMHDALVAVRDNRRPKRKYHIWKTFLGIAVALIVGVIASNIIQTKQQQKRQQQQRQQPPAPVVPIPEITHKDARRIGMALGESYGIQCWGRVVNKGAAGNVTIILNFTQGTKSVDKVETYWIGAGSYYDFNVVDTTDFYQIFGGINYSVSVR